METCPICSTPDAEHSYAAYERVHTLSCRRCGQFEVHEFWLRDHLREVKPHIVSWWIRSRNELNVPVKADMFESARLKALTKPTYLERVSAYLIDAYNATETLGEAFLVYSDKLISLCCCRDKKELQHLVRSIKDSGWMEVLPDVAVAAAPPGGRLGLLTAKGHIFCDELRKKLPASWQGFAAMWFDKSMNDAWHSGLEPGIERAGYKAFRIDSPDHIDRIDDKIIAEIRRSKFLVADLTGHRGGVYYEAGFAAGLGIPVFYSCREDHANNIHFDVRQYNCIIWSTPAELAARLQNRISAVLGDGPITFAAQNSNSS